MSESSKKKTYAVHDWMQGYEVVKYIIYDLDVVLHPASSLFYQDISVRTLLLTCKMGY
jgi:hypothetical protein